MLDRLFGIDLRALAALRIALASIVLFDLATRMPWIAWFYTDAGVQPRFFAPYDPTSVPLSLHTLSGAWAFEALLFAIAFVAAGLLLLGWRTRLAAAVVYVHQVSLWWRIPTVLNGGDAILILMLFWCLFVPLGARASLDARAGRATERGPRLLSVGGAGLRGPI
jgi:hypothetical protein